MSYLVDKLDPMIKYQVNFEITQYVIENIIQYKCILHE